MTHRLIQGEIWFVRDEDEWSFDNAVRFSSDLKFHSNGGQVDFPEVEEWMGDEKDEVLSRILSMGEFPSAGTVTR